MELVLVGELAEGSTAPERVLLLPGSTTTMGRARLVAEEELEEEEARAMVVGLGVRGTGVVVVIRWHMCVTMVCVLHPAHTVKPAMGAECSSSTLPPVVAACVVACSSAPHCAHMNHVWGGWLHTVHFLGWLCVAAGPLQPRVTNHRLAPPRLHGGVSRSLACGVVLYVCTAMCVLCVVFVCVGCDCPRRIHLFVVFLLNCSTHIHSKHRQ